jgi:tetratricopeptide (TPR) repeat protein
MIKMGIFTSLFKKSKDDTNAIAIEALKIFGQGSAYLAVGNNKKAVVLFSKCIALNEDFYEAHTCRAAALFSLGQEDDAVRDLFSVMCANPSEPEAFLDLAIYNFNQGNYKESEIAFNTVLKKIETLNKKSLANLIGFPYNRMGEDIIKIMISQKKEELVANRIKAKEYLKQIKDITGK